MKDNKIKDHRAMLAISWTLGTFATIFIGLYLIYKGLLNAEQIVAIITPILPLDIIIIRDYFQAKSEEKKGNE